MSVTYTAVLPVREQTVTFLTGLLIAERARRGTPRRTKWAPPPGVFLLNHASPRRIHSTTPSVPAATEAEHAEALAENFERDIALINQGIEAHPPLAEFVYAEREVIDPVPAGRLGCCIGSRPKVNAPHAWRTR